MQTGSVVASRFEILGEAGAGGMGTVYRARDRHSGQLVALKLVRTRDGESFDGEALLLQSLGHPGIVRYIAHGREAEGPYLVMEWLEGEDLEQRLAGGALTLAESIDVVRRAAEALAEAHRRGIVHRDLKPANIWLEGGDLARVKVLDFGVARSHMTTLETTANVIVGTPAYMAPEQVRGSSMLDARADVYSLGCVLFECITGHPPFLADDIVAVLAKTLLEHPPRLKHVRSDVPALLDDLVARMLAKDPASRPSNADALVHERAFTSAMSPRAVPTVPIARTITSGEQRLACVILFGATHVDDATISMEGWGEAVAKARRVVQSFGARIEVMIGGSVAVLVEGQGRATDEARRAASCALALKRATGAQAMALATGRAELGAVPLGDALNRAAALLRKRTVPGVRVDEVTASLLGDDFDMGDGVLLGRRESDDVRTLLGRRTPTVGRALELERIMNAFATCTTQPRATAVLVTAAAGVGKSRIRHEVVRALRARDARAEIWIARGDAFGAGSAFGLAAQLVRRAAGVLAGEPRESTHAKLSRRVRRYVSATSAGRVTTFLAEMIGAPLASSDDVVVATARRDAMVMYDQLRLAWEDFVGAECEAHPLVVVLDDLHWGDRPTLALLDSALRIFRDKPLFVVALARPEIGERFPDLWAERDIVRVDLAELPRDAATELVVDALGSRATPNVVARLVDRAAGNAFYLEELVRAVAEGRSETPDSALLMVQSRLEALEPEARRVLRAASVFGRAFWSGGVTSLVGNAVEADAWLAKLEERELVHRRVTTKFAGEQELAFNHALVQEAAHAMLTGADRALGHKLAAEWLTSTGEPDAMVLAEHWEAAGESQPALAAWTRAAEQALEGNDFAACVACADHGVRHEPQGSELARLRDLQADALRWLGDNAAMAARAREATKLSARGSDAWAESASKVALAYQRLGQVSEVVTIGEELGTAMSKPTPVLLSAGARTASVLALAGKRDEANRLLEVVEQNAHVTTDPATLARLDQARANRALFEGRVEEYVERSISAMHAFTAAGDRRLACVAPLNVGHGLLELGVSDEAEQLLSATIAEAERLGLRNIAGLATQNRGWALFRLGRVDEALAVMRASIEDFTQQANRRLQGFSHAYVARMLLARGDIEAALASAHEALALAESALPLRVAALAVIAAAQTHVGRFPEAAAAAREALAGLEAHGVEEGEAFVRLASLRALRAAGATDESEHALARARERLGQRLAAIHRPDWRERFSGVDENVQTWLE